MDWANFKAVFGFVHAAREQRKRERREERKKLGRSTLVSRK